MFNLEEVSWNEVRDQIYTVNPELAKICSQLNPRDEYTLFKIKYPYGAKIVDKGVFKIPKHDNTVLPLSDPEVPESIRIKLGYCCIPLSIILHNNNEVFVETAERVIPLNHFIPGDLFGIFETVASLANTQLTPIWSVTAGARSVFMIPKISDKINHGKIKKAFAISSEAPISLYNQWETFQEITNRAVTIDSWYNEIIVFSKEWFITANYRDTQSPIVN